MNFDDLPDGLKTDIKNRMGRGEEILEAIACREGETHKHKVVTMLSIFGMLKIMMDDDAPEEFKKLAFKSLHGNILDLATSEFRGDTDKQSKEIDTISENTATMLKVLYD